MAGALDGSGRDHGHMTTPDTNIDTNIDEKDGGKDEVSAFSYAPGRPEPTNVSSTSAADPVVAAATAGAGSRARPGSPERTPLTARLQDLVDAGFPAALASVTEANGDHVDVAVGQGAQGSGAEPPVDGEARVGSSTKMYVATVVLQLVEEGIVDLDEPIDTYLPGLVTGDDVLGTHITVRQLLQHTSGLPEYAAEIAADPFGAQHTYFAPRDLLDVAMEQRAVFPPDARWEYSNTNYLVLGLLIEHLTSRTLHEQIGARIVEPLGLTHTYLPVPGESTLRGEHPLGYHRDREGELRDITEMDPSFAWAAGAMVASPSDLNRFLQALLNGELVSEASLDSMKRTVSAGGALWPGALYGLGLQGFPLSCGGVAWGHGGDIPGTHTRNAVGPDGTAATIVVTALPSELVDITDQELLLEKYRIVTDALDETLCAP